MPPMPAQGGAPLDRDTLARLLQQQSMQNPNANAGFNAGPMPPQGAINPEPTLPTVNPISFNPGLQQGQNYPNPEPYWNTNPTRPPPPQPVMPEGWQPTQAGPPPPDPSMMEQLLRQSPGMRPGAPMPGGTPLPPRRPPGLMI